MRKKKSPLNRSITLDKNDIRKYFGKTIKLNKKTSVEGILNKTICQDLIKAVELLPKNFVDLLIIDPPYNLNKMFKSTKFKIQSTADYSEWVESFIIKLKPILKKNCNNIFLC